jgi:hypothetical protein
MLPTATASVQPTAPASTESSQPAKRARGKAPRSPFAYPINFEWIFDQAMDAYLALDREWCHAAQLFALAELGGVDGFRLLDAYARIWAAAKGRLDSALPAPDYKRRLDDIQVSLDICEKVGLFVAYTVEDRAQASQPATITETRQTIREMHEQWGAACPMGQCCLLGLMAGFRPADMIAATGISDDATGMRLLATFTTLAVLHDRQENLEVRDPYRWIVIQDQPSDRSA